MSDKKPRVLFAASECAPLCKTGGLGDVVGALPKALEKQGVETLVILPYYDTLPSSVRKNAKLVASFKITLGWKNQYAGLMESSYYGRRYYFIDNEEYFARGALYGYYEDTERFLFFSLAALEAVKHIGGIDIIHSNDWQSAFIPFMLNKFYRGIEGYNGIKTVLTIHNLRFQGTMNTDDFIAMMRFGGREPWLGEIFHNGQANLLKAGILNADNITTVSPNYAQEIKSAFYGESLQGYLNDIDYKLKGIINGIDTAAYNPNKDSKVYFNYSDMKGKRKNKQAFFNEYNLEGADSMMIGMVTRLDRQKGLDLVQYAIHEILKLDVKFVILGSGDITYENIFYHIQKAYPEKARCFITYSESLAKKIYAACDVFLMPSLFEPCGLGQLIAMRYGALPIVRETGGLKDTVIPYNSITGEGTGFSFANYNGDELIATVKAAYELYNNESNQFAFIAERNMGLDFSWEKSAADYVNLYEDLLLGL